VTAVASMGGVIAATEPGGVPVDDSFADAFTRANGDPGQPWYVPSCAFTPALAISSDALVTPGGTGVLGLLLDSDDFDLSFTVNYGTAGGGPDDVQVYFRRSACWIEAESYVFTTNPDIGSGGTAGATLYEYTTGPTVVVSNPSGGLTESSTHTWRIIVIGTAFNCYLDGSTTPFMSATIDPLAGQRALVFILDKTSSSIDDISLAVPGSWPPTPTGYAAVVAADSPLAYYRLGEASGSTMVDTSGNGRTGTYSGVTLGASGLLVGDSDTAVSCSSTTSSTTYASVTGASWMAPTNLTVEAWIETTDTAQPSKSILTRWDQVTTSNCEFGLDLGSTTSGAGRVFVNTSSGVYIAQGSTALNDGTAHHLVGVFDGSNLILYVDGTAVATTATAGTLNAPSTTLLVISGICAGPTTVNSNYGFVGTVDEVALYDTALSSTRVAAHYTAGT
jgi:hypothetical protein